MPKIRIKQPGFETVSGLVGSVEFENGVSVDSVSMRDAERLGSLFLVEDAETGEVYNAAKSVDEKLRPKHRAVRDAVEAPKSETKEEVETETEPKVEKEAEPAKEDGSERKLYTEAELSVIADEQGIHGLRDIAEALGVKDTKIVGLIKKILKAQTELPK